MDLRIQKTRKAIRDAFLALIKEKGYEKITIQNIADQAMINRNTFYLHYIDKPDLMEKLYEETFKRLEKSISSDHQDIYSIQKNDFILMIQTLFQSMEKELEFFQVMLKEHGQANLSVKLKELIKSHIVIGTKDFNFNDSVKFEVGLEYIISGIVGVVCLWVQTPEKFTITEISSVLSDVHYNNIKDLFLSDD
ncbi:TetR/AcrR family transcriptional regulator [Peribacillus sp. N1]